MQGTGSMGGNKPYSLPRSYVQRRMRVHRRAVDNKVHSIDAQRSSSAEIMVCLVPFWTAVRGKSEPHLRAEIMVCLVPFWTAVRGKSEPLFRAEIMVCLVPFWTAVRGKSEPLFRAVHAAVKTGYALVYP
jgi:uncharacterized membrane protein